jgi:hypothetical protein
MGISIQPDITEFLFIVERSGEGKGREKKVTNAITIIFNLYTYIRVFMVDGWESEAEQGDGGEREQTRRRSRIL